MTEIQSLSLIQAVELRMNHRIREIHGKPDRGKTGVHARDETACRMMFDLMRDMMSPACREALAGELFRAARELE